MKQGRKSQRNVRSILPSEHATIKIFDKVRKDGFIGERMYTTGGKCFKAKREATWY